ncbi:MAG: hypothetical protein AB7F86_14060 [Bdellovibrionales bacterium]
MTYKPTFLHAIVFCLFLNSLTGAALPARSGDPSEPTCELRLTKRALEGLSHPFLRTVRFLSQAFSKIEVQVQWPADLSSNRVLKVWQYRSLSPYFSIPPSSDSEHVISITSKTDIGTFEDQFSIVKEQGETTPATLIEFRVDSTKSKISTDSHVKLLHLLLATVLAPHSRELVLRAMVFRRGLGRSLFGQIDRLILNHSDPEFIIRALKIGELDFLLSTFPIFYSEITLNRVEHEWIGPGYIFEIRYDMDPHLFEP